MRQTMRVAANSRSRERDCRGQVLYGLKARNGMKKVDTATTVRYVF